MPIFECACGCGSKLKSGKFKYLRGHKPKTDAIATAKPKPIAREHGRFKLAIAELAKERERIDAIIDYLESLN